MDPGWNAWHRSLPASWAGVTGGTYRARWAAADNQTDPIPKRDCPLRGVAGPRPALASR